MNQVRHAVWTDLCGHAIDVKNRTIAQRLRVCADRRAFDETWQIVHGMIRRPLLGAVVSCKRPFL